MNKCDSCGESIDEGVDSIELSTVGPANEGLRKSLSLRFHQGCVEVFMADIEDDPKSPAKPKSLSQHEKIFFAQLFMQSFIGYTSNSGPMDAEDVLQLIDSCELAALKMEERAP